MTPAAKLRAAWAIDLGTARISWQNPPNALFVELRITCLNLGPDGG
ncbi:MAG: hypothetical protein WEB00_03180 [Dehalococcoidia bacterium]